MAIAGLGTFPVTGSGVDITAGIFNVRHYGAVGDGVTDDIGAILTAYEAAVAAVTTDTIPAHVTGGAALFFPPGQYRISQPFIVSKSGISIIGAGSGASSLVPTGNITGFKFDGLTSYLRHVHISGLSIDYTSQTMADSVTGLAINKCTDTCTMSDVQVLFPIANTNANLRGITLTDSESWHLSDVWIGWLRGTGSIGILIDNAGLNRGNMVFDNVLVRDAYIGLKLIGSNVTNGLVFNAFKVVNSTSGAAVVPLYGIWIAGQVYGVTFNDPHIEATQGGSFNFTTGVFLDSAGTGIRNVKINNLTASRCTTVIDLGSGGGTLQHCRVFDARVIGTETITNFLVVGSTVTDCWALGLTSQATVTNWLVDNSAANSANLFGWNLGGGSAGKPLFYKGALSLQDGAAAPGTFAGIAGVYVDVAEGPAKMKSGTGVVRKIVQAAFEDQGKNTTSTSDASITSYTLPAGVLGANAEQIRITARGRQQTQAGSFNVKFGATVLATITLAAGENWTFDALLARASATTQNSTIITIHGTTLATTTTFPSETMSGSIVIDFRGSVTAGGTLRVDQALIEMV